MEDKLSLGHPNVEAALAPANRYAEREQKRSARPLLALPFLAATALGAMLGKTHQETGEHEADADPQTTDSTPTTPAHKESLDIVNDVARYLRGVSAEMVPPEEEEEKPGAVRLSFRTPFQFEILDTGRAVPARKVIANDNQSTVLDDGGAFNFPRIRPPSVDPVGGGSPVTNPRDGHGGGPVDPGGDPDDDADPNRAPVSFGRHTLGTSLMDLSVLIMLGDLLALVRDVDGDRLSISNITVSGGAIRSYGEGMWLYTPQRGALGAVTFTYGVSDGTANANASALLTLVKAPPRQILGTDGNDTLLGTPQEDIIDGRGGDDIVYGRESNDIIIGGAGDDRLLGGDGDDQIHGGDGNDHLAGGKGHDVLFGEAGDDTLLGDEGNDILIAGAGNDHLDGGTGDDRLFGDGGDDMLFGSAGKDLLDGGTGKDGLSGGSGNDVVSGGDGDDTILAGFAGEEARAGTSPASDGDDHYSGGAGFDTYDASFATAAMRIDLDEGKATGAQTGTDILEGIEAVIGGAGGDVIVGDSADNRLDGGAGNDVLVALSGNDIVIGGAGDDIFAIALAAAVIESLGASDGDDIYEGGEGCDTYDASAARKSVVIDLEEGRATGEEIGNDRLTSVEAAIGGAGADTLYAGLGKDFLAGGAGADVFVFRSLETIRNRGEGRDEIRDFGVGDRIDLSDIAESLGGLIFEDGEGREGSHEINRIRLYHEGFDDQERTIVRAVIDFEHDEDIEILLHGRHELTAQDFILAARDALDRDDLST